MKKLLKQHHLNSDMQYFEMIIKAKILNNDETSHDLFKAMSKAYKKDFIKAIFGDWKTGLMHKEKNTFVDLL